MKTEDQIISSIFNIYQKILSNPIIDCCEPGPLEEHPVFLTTEQSLRPHIFIYCSLCVCITFLKLYLKCLFMYMCVGR